MPLARSYRYRSRSRNSGLVAMEIISETYVNTMNAEGKIFDREGFRELIQQQSLIYSKIKDETLQEELICKIIMPAMDREVKHAEEVAQLNEKIRDLLRINNEKTQQLLKAAALPSLRCLVERCEVLYFTPFTGSDLGKIEEEEKQKLREAMEKIMGKSQTVEELIISHKVGYHYKKWMFILSYSDHASVKALKAAILQSNEDSRTTRSLMSAFACNVAALYGFASAHIHNTFAGEYESEKIISAISELGFTDPCFISSIRTLMRIVRP